MVISAKDNLMKNWILIIAVICLIGLIALNYATKLIPSSSTKPSYINRNDVLGMAVEYKQLPYTLNFKEQNAVINFLNESQPHEKSLYEPDPTAFPFTRLIIYRFNGPEIQIIPIALPHQDLVFAASAWDRDRYFHDVSKGELFHLLNTTYDP
jgi:hypothetical protein